MATLDHWKPYLAPPKTIVFPTLELKGHDAMPSPLVGTGEVQIPSLNMFKFTLTGKPNDLDQLFDRINRMRADPYDGLARFRLFGVDEDGLEWLLGWTTPQFKFDAEGVWTFWGELDGISPAFGGPSVSQVSSTEAVYIIPINNPITSEMTSSMQIDEAPGPLRYEHRMEVLGSDIRCTYEANSNTLTITVPHSEGLPPAFTEGWLSQLLPILFGQPITPRLLARNLGEGQTLVFINRSPGFIRGAGWASLCAEAQTTDGKGSFWDLYARLIAFFAQTKTHPKEPRFQPYKVARYYQEVIQAAQGSRWVMALTLASSVEGLVNIIVPKGEKVSDPDTRGINQLVGHIKEWEGSAALKEAALNAVHRTALLTPNRALRGLRDSEVITNRQLEVWRTVRNAVMHGQLVSPYSHEEEDELLLDLAAMMHSLTLEILRRSALAGSE